MSHVTQDSGGSTASRVVSSEQTELPTKRVKRKGKRHIVHPYKWSKFDIGSDAMCEQLGKLLDENYSSTGAAFDYSKKHLRWALQPPGYKPKLMIGVWLKETNILVGFISGVPARLSVGGIDFEMAQISILCV